MAKIVTKGNAEYFLNEFSIKSTQFHCGMCYCRFEIDSDQDGVKKVGENDYYVLYQVPCPECCYPLFFRVGKK